MTECALCSRQIPSDSRLCPYCAAPVGSTEDSRTVTVQTIPPFKTASDVEMDPSSPDSIHHGRFTPGTILINRYRIVGLLGKGGMGEVYRAEDVILHQQVALKFLPEAYSNNEQLRHAFQQEVRIARHVSHPNVCRVYDICDAVAGEYFITMEYIDGENLASLTRRIGRLPEDVALRIARQLCAGLAAAHEKGVLHRDLKPKNIMFDGRGKAYIADFGIAGFARSFTPGHRNFGAGTLAYMAPEQLAQREVTEKSDIYSLGLVLYYLFTGLPAFIADSVEELMRVRANGTITPPSRIVDDLDPKIERLILRCLQDEPSARPVSALTVARNLPGGDHLAELVAAGVTPSTDLVAGSGGGGDITPKKGIALLVAGLFGIALVALLADKSSLLAYVPLPKSPAVLADRAEEIITQLTGTTGTGSRVFGFAVDHTFLSHITISDRTASRWKILGDGHSPGIYFWFRKTPSPLNVVNPLMQAIGPSDPLSEPGAASVRLNPRGQLIAFEWLPRESYRLGDNTTPSWSSIFEEAGLLSTDFSETMPVPTSPVRCDTIFAWQQRKTDDTTTSLRVEAGTMLGKLVFFQIVRPWDRATTNTGSGDSAYDIMTLTLTVVCLGMSLFLARRNLRLEHGDLKGAKRLVSFYFVSMMLVWLLETHHTLRFGSEWRVFASGMGVAMFWSGFCWLMYIALEPFMRRRWPRTLIGWNRLLSGKMRDPIVGSDLLIGVVLGTVLLACDQLTHLVPSILEMPPPTPYVGSMNALLGMPYHITVGIRIVLICIWSAFALLFLSFLVYILVRSERWAKLIFFLLVTAVWFLATGSGSYVIALFCALQVSVIMVALFRYGLLALTTTLFTAYLLSSFPVTWNVSSWQFGGALFAMLGCALLASFGCHRCVAGRPLLSKPFLSEMDETN